MAWAPGQIEFPALNKGSPVIARAAEGEELCISARGKTFSFIILSVSFGTEGCEIPF